MKRPLRILYYNTFLTSNSPEGMVSRQFLTAARMLKGWDLITLPSFQPSSVPNNGAKSRRHKKFVPATLRKTIRSFLSPISPYPVGPYLHTRRMRTQLVEALNQQDPFDLAFFHLSQGDLAVLAEACSQITIPLVLRVPAPLAYEADHVLYRHMSEADRQREQFLYEKASAILVISKGMKQILCATGVPAEKIFVCPNGLDFSTFVVNENQGDWVRNELGLDDCPVVGYVGSFWPGNDIDTLLKAWQLVEAEEKTAVLLLVGEGPLVVDYKQQSKQLNLKNCHWLGRIPHTQVPDYISAMDVGVGPYVQEALTFVSPLKVMEYAAMGCPVVASNGGQIKEIIKNGETGYIYEPHNAKQLADGILQLLSAPDKAKEMGRNARIFMQDWYSWDKLAGNILSLCQEIIDDEDISHSFHPQEEMKVV